MKLYQDDCLEVMRNIADKSVDCIITDPPYKITAGGRTTKRKINISKEETRNKTGLLFEIPKFNLWLKECYRVIKEDTHIYLMTNSKNLYEMLGESLKVGFELHEILVWDKQMAMPTQWYLKNVEYILFMRKGKAKPIKNLGTNVLIKLKGIRGNKIHPSEKPTELMKIFIENSSNENDIILDPFMGSGTTGVACQHLNRNFIGIELDETYFNIAKERIEKAHEEKELF